MFQVATRFKGVRGTIFWGQAGVGYCPKKWVRDDKVYQDCTLDQFKEKNWHQYGCEDLSPSLPYATIEDMGYADCLPSIVAVFVPHGADIKSAHGVVLPSVV